MQSTTLLPNPGKTNTATPTSSNDARNQPFYLNVPPKVRGSKQLKLIGLPRGCVTGDFTLTAISKVAQTKKMKIKADLGFDTRTATTCCSRNRPRGGRSR